MQQELISSIANRETYARSDVQDHYQSAQALFTVEKMLFEKLSSEISNSRILDIGVGGGRTAPHLLLVGADYTGVDYVPQFVEETHIKFPHAKILVGDARNLGEFEDESFDFVLFSFNGLDCISHEDRLRALKEIYRVLSKDCIFMFSSHNRDYKYFKKLPWRRKIEYDRKFLKWFLYCLYHLPKHRAMKQHEIFADDYAVVNDSDHRYSLLLYYISIDKQIEQLAALGFSNVEAYDMCGNQVTSDVSSHWLYYLATKK